LVDWDACLAGIEGVDLTGQLLRLVESQEQVATNQLVDSLAKQALLEELLEASKPPPRPGTAGLHYLLATPFRYPPLKHGSRFGRRHEPSLFYGAHESRCVMAEAAYYRFVFWYGMRVAPARKLDTQHTLFAVEYRTQRGLRLQDPPFAAHEAMLRHPADYAASQALGSRMRESGIDAFEYVSARDPHHGINVALFSPEAFAQPKPVWQEPWLAETTGMHVRYQSVHGKARHAFPVEVFQVDGRLPLPA